MLWKDRAMPRTDVSAFVAEAAADVPDRQALVEGVTYGLLQSGIGPR